MLGFVQDFSQRGIRTPHHAFHPVSRANEMTFIDALNAPSPDEKVFVVICHADDLMRHNLANGQDQIVAPFPDELVQLRRPRLVEDPLGRLLDEC